MKKSEAFDSSLKKTFDECCEGEELKKEWRRFEEFMDKYKRHAGEWHNWDCVFPEVDEANCNCNLFKNKKQVKSFISSLLAKQQEEFVKIVNNLYVAKPRSKAEEEPYEVKKMIMEECKQAILADIKSKLNKEEPAYIGGVNLTTNDTEISSRLAVTDKNIDQLRQWLNEDRIDDFKKMITNDDIKFWLDIK